MKRKTFICSLLAIIFALAFIGCEQVTDPAEDKDQNLPVLTGAVSISPNGVAIGAELDATYDGAETVNFQWNRDGAAITGATPAKYIPAAAGSYTVTVSAPGYSSKTSTAVTVTGASNNYIITGSGATFTAKKDDGTQVGTADQPINTVINAIRTNAGNNQSVAIQFGNGTDPLDIGTESAAFSGTGGSWWGTIFLSGSITSANTGTSTIQVNLSTSIISVANIANTSNAVNSRTILNQPGGMVTISGGTVSGFQAIANSSSATVTIVGGTVSAVPLGTGVGSAVLNGGSGTVTISGGILETTETSGGTPRTVFNQGSGAITITGGTISANLGVAVQNDSGGTVTISGGTVTSTANTGIAVRNNSEGDFEISGTAYITSKSTTQATVVNEKTGYLIISGGTVDNTSTGIAVRNNSNGFIPISGDAVVISKNTDNAEGTIVIADSGTGTSSRLTVSGGTVKNTASTGNAVYNASIGTVNIYGGTLSTVSGFAVQNTNATAAIALGGDPAITGRIRPLAASKLRVVTGSGPTQFLPATNRVYTLDYPEYTDNMVAVTGGGSFLSNFALYNQPTYTLMTSDGNLAVRVPTQTPVAGDYDISGTGTFTYSGNARTVTITAKSGKSPGAVTISYGTSGATAPTNAGTYTVTFNVAAATGWNAASGLAAGTLTINKATGATVSAPAVSGTPTTTSITLNAITAPSTGQTVEYARNTTNSAPTTGWQDSTSFTGLTIGTTYYFFARSKSNDNYNTGTASTGTAIATSATSATAVTTAAIPGVTAPAAGATPVTAITETTQYTGTVTWSPTVALGGTFAPSTTYTATITLTAKTGYTFTGVAANFFTVAGTSSAATNPANSGVVTAAFPATATGNQTPVAADYTISGIGTSYYSGSARTVTITAKIDKSPGAITISYGTNGATAPTNVGTYTVTFSVAAATGWNAASGLAAGTITINRANGASVTAPTRASATENSVTLNAVTASTGQTVEYARNTTNSAPSSGWQSGLTFSGLTAGTTYYFFARSAQNTNYNAGTASNGTAIATSAGTTVTTVSIAAIPGVTAPVTGATPVTTITETTQYTGTVSWTPTVAAGGTFAINTTYTATITLTAKTGYTFTGVAANFFTVAESTSRSNSANSGTVTAAFPATVAPLYVITPGVTSGFRVRRGSATGATVGQTQQALPAAIEAIRADAAGANCTIQFGDGTATLDTGTTSAAFANSNGSWGAITLTGKITSTVAGTSSGTVTAGAGAPITSTADIANTSSGSNAVYVLGTGAITISGGTVSATTGAAVYLNGAGTATISGGTVSATTGYAVYNGSTGAITVSGNATVTSANTTATNGTIYLNNSGTATATRLTISGGTVKNTSTTGNAVYNASTGAVSITGGTVSGASGNNARAVYNASTGATTISGGTVSTTIGSAVYNSGTGSVTISGAASVEATTGRAVDNNATGTVTVSGGTVSATSGDAVFNDTGTITISGGTVSATTGRAVHNRTTGTIAVSGAATVTSANTTSASSGTIYFNTSGGGTNGKLTISGGTVKNTSTTGNAVFNTAAEATITGGTVEANGGYAVVCDTGNANPTIILGGSPTITGSIRPSAAGKLSVLRTGTNAFNPGNRTYALDYATLASGGIAVVDGGTVSGTSFLARFTLRAGGSAATLIASGANLVRQ